MNGDPWRQLSKHPQHARYFETPLGRAPVSKWEMKSDGRPLQPGEPGPEDE